MTSKTLLIFFVSFLTTLQTWGRANHTGNASHNTNHSTCTVNTFAGPPLIEPGDSTLLYVNTFNDTIYSVSWSPSSSVTNPTASNTYAHPKVTTTYTVTATTSCGTITDTVTVFIGCSLKSILYSAAPYCCASKAGTASIYLYNGTPPYTYIWSNGQTTPNATGLSIGSYSVLIKDSNGCGTTDTFHISQAFFSVLAYSNVVELGDSAALIINTDEPYYNISWSPSASVSKFNAYYEYAHPDTTTIYTATLSTPCGILTDTVTVHVGCALESYIYPTPYYCNLEGGTAIAYITHGKPPYTYTWSSGQTTSNISGLSLGTYSLTVQDSYGCSSFDTVTIGLGTITLNANSTLNTVEQGDSTFLYSYGYPTDSTVSYSWSPSTSVTNPNSTYTIAYPTKTTTYTLTVTTPCGIYTDTVTVFIGCSASVAVLTSNYFCSSDSGSATAQVYNGIKPYSYTWSTGQTSSNITGLSVGSYSVAVTDAQGCKTANSGYIYSSSFPLIAYATATTIYPGDSTFLYTNFYPLFDHPNTYPYTYSWSPSASVTSPDSANTYAHPKTTTTYTVTAITPCGIMTDTITIFMSCTNTFNQDICIVTTDTAIDKNVIIWGRNNSPPDGSFNIYDSTSTGWKLIATLPDTALSEYIDTASKPNLQSYSYRISTVDSCGESDLSPFNSTIFLQVIQYTGEDSLYWTPYVGFSPPYYLIYKGPSLNSLTLIDSVSGSILSYIDKSPTAGDIYLLEAENPSGGCVPTHRHVLPTHGSSINSFISISNGGIPHKPYVNGGINLYPNPNSGKFTILSSVNEQLSVEIYNAIGEKIYTSLLNSINTEINLSIEPSGVYLYRVITQTGDLVSQGKFIKD